MIDIKARQELEDCLSRDDKMLGQIFNLLKVGVTDAKELVEKSTAANRGVVYNNLTMIAAILDEKMPTGSTISRHSGYAINRIVKDNPGLSVELKLHLLDLKQRLIQNSESLNAVQHDQINLDQQSEILAQQASTIKKGIYVYSFPTYLHFGTVEDQEVFWLKIGSTNHSVWQRIVEQNRQTSMPEDPKLLRIYHDDDMDIEAIEKKFHATLDAVGHERSAARRTKSGKEWFATTLDAVDAIAKLMNLKIERYEESNSLI